MNTNIEGVPPRQPKPERRGKGYPVHVEFIPARTTPAQDSASARFWDTLILRAAGAISREE